MGDAEERRDAIRSLLAQGAFTQAELARYFTVHPNTIYRDLLWLQTTYPRTPVIMIVNRECRFTLIGNGEMKAHNEGGGG
ncbi:MAG: hypothetical protein FJZ90_19990 [Chloroflexi bacterium]|nr:hypothetical protein [Chloroflexota bacterium]